MLSDLEIALSTPMRPITEIAHALGIEDEELDLYGNYKAKLSDNLIRRVSKTPDGKLVLVTAITPTPAGEGKTTTTVGLGQSLNALGHRAIVVLREPSLGPVFGIKGGAAGGGYAQVLPMEDINLHFTGDLHAVAAANNLISAIIDNHLHQGNSLRIDTRRIVWKRCLDMNDRALRHTVVGLGGKADGIPREDGFNITVASEIMAVLCLAEDLSDLRERISRIVVADNADGHPVTVADLKAAGAVTALLREALKPNLIQTTANTPALMHGGPFANIAHGCNSLRATKLALKLGDIVVTEAGFGADLGAEKFFDIKCRMGAIKPDAVVIVASVRALKHHGGVPKTQYGQENVAAVTAGFANLNAHIDNIARFGLPSLVAINRFPTDTEAELEEVIRLCREAGARAALSEVFTKGSEGGLELANALIDMMDTQAPDFRLLYPDESPLVEKIRTIASEIYGAADVAFSVPAAREIARIEQLGYGHLPICMAKTQYSFSDDPTKTGRPTGFTLQVREIRLSAGAGFVVAITGDIMTMPGLPKSPAAERIDIDGEGNIIGLF